MANAITPQSIKLNGKANFQGTTTKDQASAVDRKNLRKEITFPDNHAACTQGVAQGSPVVTFVRGARQ